jgi:serine/threonine-protein kinase
MCPRCLLELALGPEQAPEPDDGMQRPDIGVVVGGYTLVAELARGGGGIVYRARHNQLGREVALKMILPQRLLDRVAFRRFEREARAMAELAHPNIMPIHEIGQHGGLPFLAMPLAAGGDLAARIERYRRDWRAIAHLLAILARAVDHAHRLGLLHRDLKPGNILFDDQDRPWVSDFGLARRIADDGTLTLSESAVGTPRYMAPESFAGDPARLDARTDVYSLGAILYELITGQAPHAGLAPLQVVQEAAVRAPVPAQRLAPGAPAALVATCLRALAIDPGKRQASAAAFAGELEAWLAGRAGQPAATRRRQILAAATVLAGAISALALIRSDRRSPPLPVAGAGAGAAASASAAQAAEPVAFAGQVAVLPLRDQADSPDWPAAAGLADRLARAGLPVVAPTRIRTLAADGLPDRMPLAGALGTVTFVEVAASADARRWRVRALDAIREQQLWLGAIGVGDAAPPSALLAALRQHAADSGGNPLRIAAFVDAIVQIGPGGAGNDAAIERLKAILEQAPDDALAHAWLAAGYNHRASGASGLAHWADSAIDSAERALRADPGLALAQRQLGYAFHLKGWGPRALAATEAALALGDIAARRSLALQLYGQGRYVEALTLYLDDLPWRPDDPEAPLLVAHVLYTIGDPKAAAPFNALARARHPVPAARVLLEAEALFFQGELAGADALMSDLDPYLSAGGLFGLHELHRASRILQGNFAAAQAAIEQQRAARGDTIELNAATSVTEAALLAELGRHAESAARRDLAADRLRVQIDAGDTRPLLVARHAALLHLAGDAESAWRELDRALALGLRINHRIRGQGLFLPFRHDSRWPALLAAQDAALALDRARADSELGRHEANAADPAGAIAAR